MAMVGKGDFFKRSPSIYTRRFSQPPVEREKVGRLDWDESARLIIGSNPIEEADVFECNAGEDGCEDMLVLGRVVD